MNHKPQRHQIWQQNKDKSLVGIRDVTEATVVFYSLGEGRRTIKDFERPIDDFLTKFTRHYMPDELDETWRRLADENYPHAAQLARSFDRTAELYESYLRQLREIAHSHLKGTS